MGDSAHEQAEEAIANLDKEYAPISGDANFTKLSAALAFGDDSPVIKNGNVRACVSLRLCTRFAHA